MGDMSPDDLRKAYAAGKAKWAAMTPEQQRALMDVTNKPDMKWLQDMGKAKGGKITATAGKKVGKDDGVIPAKKGEYVVKKSSTSKYGDNKMAAVNRGTAKISAPARAKKR
jgi:hypothetical protein